MSLRVKRNIKFSLVDFKLPEMRSLWIFISLIILLIVVDYVFVSLSIVVKVAGFLLLGVIVFWNNLKVAKTNQEIKLTVSRLNDIVANLYDGIIAYDTDFKILIVNDTALKLFNIKKEEIVGQYFGPERVNEPRFRLLTQALFPSLAPLVIKRNEGDERFQVVDISFTEPNLDFRITTVRAFLPDGQTSGFIKIIHDRTRELQLYRSKAEFITTAAHQLRTPLNGMNWALESLSKSESIGEASKETVNNALVASAKALKIVNDLLDVAKIEEGRFGYAFENLDIVKFLENILENANPSAQNYGLKLYFDNSLETSVILKVDPNRLGMALSNILDNAIRYNVENGSISVKLERLKDKPYVQITVSDTGIGIPPNDMSKMFVKFFRAENAVRFKPDGSGFGLYITKNIINRHGGNIWIESTLGRGTTIYITLPTDPSLIPPKEMIYEES